MCSCFQPTNEHLLHWDFKQHSEHFANFAVCPRIYSKSEWGGSVRSNAPLPNLPASWMVIHHSTGDNCDSHQSCSEQMRYLEMLHTTIFGWSDIGYNFCIGNDGSIYEGRGFGYQGLHSPDFNQQSLGVCFLGTYTSEVPSAEALQALRDLSFCAVDGLYMSNQYYMIGHRQDVSTECPGEALFNEISTWPRFYRDLAPEISE